MKQGWEIKKLGEVCSINYGTRVVQKKDGGTIYPVYGGGGATFKMDRYNREDCLIVSRFAMSNQCVRYVSGKFFLNDSGLTIESNEVELSQSFLDKHITALNDTIYSLGKGVAQKNLDIKELKLLDIKYPKSLAEQERIVAELDCLSGVIEKKREQLKELDALAQSIFYQMFGDPISNEKVWEVKKLGEVCDVCSSRRVFVDELVEDGVPFYRGTEIGQMAEGEIIIPTLYITLDHYERLKEETGIPQIGDLLLPSICNDGRIWLVSTDAPYYFKDGRVLWIKCAGKIDGQFLRYQLKNIFINNYNKIASGTTFAELKIFILRELKINIPPLTLQQEFADKIEAIEKQKEIIKQSIIENETLFNARMDYYFN